MIRRPPRSTLSSSSAASDVYKRQLEHAVRGVLGRGRELVPVLVPALRQVHLRVAEHRAHGAEEVVEHVPPVRVHVEDEATAVLLAGVPRGAVDGLPVALEDPVAEVEAQADEVAEEATVDESLELLDPRQEELVLDHTGLHPGVPGEPRELERVTERGGR